MTKLIAAALLTALPCAALAGSGSMITKIRAGNPGNPFCLSWLTQNEPAKWYGVSRFDPLFEQILITINNGRGSALAPTYTVGTPNNPDGLYHPEDCANTEDDPITYVHTVIR